MQIPPLHRELVQARCPLPKQNVQVPDPAHLLQIFVVGAEPLPEDEEGTEGLVEEELLEVEVLGAAVETAAPQTVCLLPWVHV